MSRIIILLSVVLLSPTAAPEATDCPGGYREIARGFLTGQECLEQNETDLSLYVAGIVDGLHVSPLAGASKNCLRPLEQSPDTTKAGPSTSPPRTYRHARYGSRERCSSATSRGGSRGCLCSSAGFQTSRLPSRPGGRHGRFERTRLRAGAASVRTDHGRPATRVGEATRAVVCPRRTAT